MNKKFEKWAWTIIKKYQNILLLNDHIVTLEYKKMKEEVVMEHEFMYPYKNTNIRYGEFALEWWKKKKYKQLTDVLIHELCHSVTDPLYSVGHDRFTTKDSLNEARERITDHIANVITHLTVDNRIK